MEQETEEEQKCRNCKYFSVHYVNLYGRFMPLVSGHCINGDVPRNVSKKLIDKHKVCELWEPMCLQKEERRMHIEKILTSMAKDINDTAQILKNDN